MCGVRKTCVSGGSMNETWKQIQGTNYHVSNLGRVKSPHKILKTGITTKGYHNLTLISKEGKRLTRTVHRLVGEYHVPNPNEYKQLNHINGDKNDNRSCNLEWCTASHNIRHAKEKGLAQVGEQHKNAKLTNTQTKEIKQCLKDKKNTHKELAAMYNVSPSTIGHIAMGIKWRYV